MKQDFSKLLYDKYISTSYQTVSITLKNKTIISGKIVSFVRGDWGENYIQKWRIQPTDGSESFLVLQKNIFSMLFVADNELLQLSM